VLTRLKRIVYQNDAALLAFVVSRTLIFVIFILTAHFTSNPSAPGDVRIGNLSLYGASVWTKTRETIFTADAYWYAGIAREGYHREPYSAERPRNWAFFPLYPILLRGATAVVGEVVLAGVILSQICFLLALVLLQRTAVEFGLDEAAARRAVIYLALSPVSYFFSLPLPESLFLVLTVGSFYAACRGSWPTAGVLGAFASATRFQGVLLVPALLLLYLQHRRGSLKAAVLSILIVPAGLVAFMLYLHQLTGYALAFKGAQGAPGWYRRFSPLWSPFVEYFSHPGDMIEQWNFKPLHVGAAVLALACGVDWLRRREWALATYTLLSFFLAFSSGHLMSGARYMSVVFPIFMWLGVLSHRSAVDETVRAVFAALLGILSVLFAAQYGFVLA
jgi:Mannosyltransferase (PIG-V)